MVIHHALRGSVAGVPRCVARVLALVVDAGPVCGTVGVGSTSYQNASDVGVAHEAWRALADRPVVGAVAQRLGSAGRTVGGTDRDALAVDARMLPRALVIRPASGSDALALGVSFETLPARANGLVVLDSAFGVRAAVARVPADSVHASLVGDALRVGDAGADFLDRLGRFAGSASAADVAWRTHTDHGSNGDRSGDIATRRPAAGLEDAARILALVVDTCQFGRAFRIFPAFRFGFLAALHVGVPDVSRRTPA